VRTMTIPQAAPTTSIRRRTVTAAIVTMAAVAAAASVATAAWNVTGSGSGSAAASSAVPLVIEGFVLDVPLYPGLTADGRLTVSNPNLFPVNITDVVFGTLVVSDAAGAGCTIVASHVTFADTTSAALFLAADTEDIELVLSGVATMGAGSSNDCQGATFTAPISLTAESTTP
jgi:hypothetical protein